MTVAIVVEQRAAGQLAGHDLDWEFRYLAGRPDRALTHLARAVDASVSGLTGLSMANGTASCTVTVAGLTNSAGVTGTCPQAAQTMTIDRPLPGKELLD